MDKFFVMLFGVVKNIKFECVIINLLLKIWIFLLKIFFKWGNILEICIFIFFVVWIDEIVIWGWLSVNFNNFSFV